ncbi:uncharacterized protein LOC112054321 [Bicyclus anynana]|uniref:Uncharacterized protein LOC112054321 n=1 Tax=Bicyclus anynana TaxID=110368 RepID=A0ABM3LYA4_BICAN|nr:uncharacterized protein LOC112054321 [Bicyclus anynana]
MNFSVIFSILIITVAIAEKKSYEGYSVYKLTPKTVEDVVILDDIRLKGVGEFWYDQLHVNSEARIMVPKQNRQMFNDLIEQSSMKPEELIQDLQRVIDEQLTPIHRSGASNESFLGMSWNQYYDLNQINNWLDEVVKNYPSIVTPVVMGRSFENRDIRGIIIRYKPRRDGTTPLIGMLEGTLHAREWITPATITWIVKEFLTSNDPEVRALAENIEWHIFPVVNPDGYVYTFTTNRMWRKNRSTQNFVSCAASGVSDDMSNGIDLNRNFDYVWMTAGASNNPCLNTFAGPVAFSEPEARAIANYVIDLNTQGKMIYYFGFHSFLQLIVIPFSHVSGQDVLLANNYADMFEISIKGAEKLEERFGTKYRVGASADIMYPMSGTSFDWVKHTTNIPVSLLIELRDLGQYGFLLPAEQIIPTSLEIMDALLEMDRTTRKLGYYSAEYVSYDNHKVYKLHPQTEEQVELLRKLQDTEGYTFWTLFDYVKVDREVRIMLDANKEKEFLNYMKSAGLEVSKTVEDVQSLINEQLKRPQTLGRSALDYDWTYYPNLEEVEDWMNKTAEKHPDVVTLLDIGRSFEGRPIRGLKIDFKKVTRPVMGVLEGTLHAREWITTVTLTWLANEFLNSKDPNVRFLAENVVWHIFPVTNPDGFVYTFTDDRMWRKNRNPTNFTSCASSNVRDDLSNGVDLNRNFGFLWMTVGASQNPCAQTFAGASAFSEPESRAVANYVLDIQKQGELVYYMAFHSYSQMILVPFSHTSGAAVLEVPNYADLFEIAIRGAEKLTAVHNIPYQVGTSADILYEVSGSGFDWVKGVAKVPIVHLFELRDVGQYGFLLPPEQIIPNNEEVMAGLIEMDRVTRELGYYTPPPSSGFSNKMNALLLIGAVMFALV